MESAALARPSRPAAPRSYVGLEREPDARMSPLLFAICVYLLTAVIRIHQLFPALGNLRLTLLSAGGALALILVDHGSASRVRAAWSTPAVRWMFALVAWSLFSIPLALYPGGAFTVATDLIKAFAMLGTVVSAVRGIRDTRRVAVLYFIGVVVFAVYVLLNFQVEEPAGRYGKLIYYDANEFALLAASSLPFGAYTIWHARNLAARLALMAGLGAVFVAFVFCGSRGGVIGLSAGLVYAVFSLRMIKLKWRVAATAVLAGAFVAVAADAFWNRVDAVVDQEEDYNFTSPTGRVQVWKRGVGYMLDRPVFGVGVGNFQTAEGRLSDYAANQRVRNAGYKWSAAHNSYVQVGAELGLPGLAFFVLAIGGAVHALRRVTSPRHRVKLDPELTALAYASTVAIVIFATGATFLSLAYSDMLFALLAIAMAIQVVARQRAHAYAAVVHL